MQHQKIALRNIELPVIMFQITYTRLTTSAIVSCYFHCLLPSKFFSKRKLICCIFIPEWDSSNMVALLLFPSYTTWSQIDWLQKNTKLFLFSLLVIVTISYFQTICLGLIRQQNTGEATICNFTGVRYILNNWNPNLTFHFWSS